jgi:hypothetical protein
MVAGFHVPVTPLLDVIGNAGAVAFWHNGPMALKAGVTWLLTSISIVEIEPH